MASLEKRLARIEQALAAQSEKTLEVLARVVRANDARRNGPTAAGPAATGMAEEMDAALRQRREHLVPVDQPLALICQAPRSGGTLLARLFDGHPQCHVHPHELHIGARRPHTWPQLGLDEDPASWFAKLQEAKLTAMFGKGKRKIPLKGGTERSGDHYPLLLPPSVHRLLFLDEVARRSPIESERQILDCYMTGLFNGWLDNQNLMGGEKRWVVAFSPRRAWGDGLKRHFQIYPDGRLISILRDPLSWYTSAQGRDPRADVSELLELWKRSAREMLVATRRHGERTSIVKFDELLLDTEGAMRRLAGFLDIDYDPQLTVPTFNRNPVGANSSYDVTRTGVVTDPLSRHTKLLSSKQESVVRSECWELYEEALGLAGQP
jgi:Sulfotransferase family